MFAALAIIALTRQALPDSFCYVWIGESGQMLAIPPKGLCQLMVGERHVAFNRPSSVPNGDYVGKWTGSKRMVTDGSEARPASPESDGDYGEVRIRLAPPDAYGRSTSLFVRITNANGQIKLDECFFPCLKLDSLDFNGKFSDDHSMLDLEESIPKSSNEKSGAPVLTGSITYNGVRRLLKGTRNGMRGTFKLIGLGYGEVQGDGYLVWNPTVACAKKIRENDQVKTDQLTLFLRIPELPNGKEMALKRTPR